MNIKRVKEELKHTIAAYLCKDEFGAYKIPVVRQRPVFLIGPPGIGKTAIMEQVARECEIGLVSYTITHHTRQSAIGLPFIEQKNYGGSEFAITEYTMSEIIASVYEKMEETGLKEGILFIDEINCVSETLAPTMLQFLQGKTFGSHKVPEGWIIVAAGNPPEYNKSVREFDIVTLDRVKKIEVNEDYSVWKEYAYKQNIHGAILSYLDIKKEHFYQMESTVDGKRFITARGWEDLSEILYAYEELGFPVDAEVIGQYLQHPKIAKDFANYLELYYKYQNEYDIETILSGEVNVQSIEKLRMAPFDEKLSVIGLLLSKLSESFQISYHVEQYTELLFSLLKRLKENIEERPQNLWNLMGYLQKEAEEDLHKRLQAGLMEQKDARDMERALSVFEGYRKVIQNAQADLIHGFEMIKAMFQGVVENRSIEIDDAKQELEYAFDFMELVFGESQEMVIFITELTANYYSMRFISEYGCERYFRYNKSLLFHEAQKEILNEIAKAKKESLFD